jgi:hypothetical protein
MRLNPFNTSDIRVRSSGGGGGRMPGGAGGLGCGGLVIVIIGALVFGVDPGQMVGMVGGMQQSAPATQPQGELSEDQICSSSDYAREACSALGSLNKTWQPAFARAGIAFKDPALDLFRNGSVDTQGCGSATSASGPFYCPADQTIYIDTSFYDQLAQMSGTQGDFARLYVIAHEYGHHIQTLTGISDQVRSAQQQNPQRANQLQVLMELQADCYAGVWAGKNRNLIEPGDLEEGMKAASSIGDDTLMRNAGQRVNPEAFTHGTSAQRMKALRDGMQGGDDTVCDAYFQ